MVRTVRRLARSRVRHWREWICWQVFSRYVGAGPGSPDNNSDGYTVWSGVSRIGYWGASGSLIGTVCDTTPLRRRLYTVSFNPIGVVRDSTAAAARHIAAVEALQTCRGRSR